MLLGVGQEQATKGLTSAPWSLRGTEPRAVWLMATSGMPAPDAILQAEREAAELEAARQADEARLAAVEAEAARQAEATRRAEAQAASRAAAAAAAAFSAA